MEKVFLGSFASQAFLVDRTIVVPRPLTSLAATSQVIKTFHRRYTRKGTFIFRTRRRIHDVAATPHDYGDDFENHELGTMDASITFVPKTPQSSHIAVCFQQRMLFSGSFLKKPILSVSALLPDDSEVFLLIQRGDLNSLVKKLSLREASLTARDSKGRSLLNVSIVCIAGF